MMRRSLACRLVIAGAPLFGDDTYFERVRAEAAGSAVEFIGWVEDTSRFLAEVDLVVVPSSGLDATPRVISEAFSAGVPVLAFATGGIPEMISHGKDGFLIHQHSAEALASAIDEAVSCPERLSEIAARGRIRWRETSTVERFQCEVCETVQEVAQRRHQRNPLTTSGAIAEV
jgi:glycosyltransferase involved in cell wall biosynthesis